MTAFSDFLQVPRSTFVLQLPPFLTVALQSEGVLTSHSCMCRTNVQQTVVRLTSLEKLNRQGASSTAIPPFVSRSSIGAVCGRARQDPGAGGGRHTMASFAVPRHHDRGRSSGRGENSACVDGRHRRMPMLGVARSIANRQRRNVLPPAPGGGTS